MYGRPVSVQLKNYFQKILFREEVMIVPQKKIVVKSDLPTFAETQTKAIFEKTPKNMIKRREGRGGKTFDYVEVGYVVNKLNEVFNYLWDWEIADQGIG